MAQKLMSMRTFITTVLLLAILSFSSCRLSGKRVEGNGNVSTEQRTISNATKIKVLGSMDVYLTEGPTAVRVEAEDNVIRYIITEVEDGWLEVKTRDHINLVTHAPVKVYISTPTINGISIAGSGNVMSDTRLKSDEKVGLRVSGSGDITLQVNAPGIDANIAGSGDINVSGETRDVKVKIAGSGNYKGGELKAENANVDIAGSGDAEIFADVRLSAKIIGSGNVAYKGNAEVNKKVVGSGDVSKAE